MWMRYPKPGLTWNRPEQDWIALNSYIVENDNSEKPDPIPYSMKLADWLQDPNVKIVLENTEKIADFVFKNDKGIRITEDEAIALNEQFDVNAAPIARRRVFTVPQNGTAPPVPNNGTTPTPIDPIETATEPATNFGQGSSTPATNCGQGSSTDLRSSAGEPSSPASNGTAEKVPEPATGASNGRKRKARA